MIHLESDYTFFDQFIIRLPTRPFSQLKHSSDKSISDFINGIYKRADVMEAIYIASPILYQTCEKFVQGKLTRPKDISKLYQSLYKYYYRMHSRCTPYGLFAACGVGSWNNRNEVVLSGFKRHSRLDMDVCNCISKALEREPELRNNTLFFSNTSLYEIGGQIRYVESKTSAGKRNYQVSSVTSNPYLKKIIALSKTGIQLKTLIQLLVDDNIPEQEGAGYLNLLIDEQVLVSEFELNVTGTEYIPRIISRLSLLNSSLHSATIDLLINKLSAIELLLQKIDSKFGNGIAEYNEIEHLLKSFSLHQNGSAILTQTDSFPVGEPIYLDRQIQKSITRAIKFLNKIYPTNRHVNLESFVKRFLDRYEEAEVPLLQALDIENGIGYLQDGFSFDDLLIEGIKVSNSSLKDFEFKVNKTNEKIFKKILGALNSKAFKIELFDVDFTDVDYSTNDLPHVISVAFKVIDKTSNKIQLNFCANNLNLIGRFTGGHKETAELAKAIAKYDQELQTNKIVAEIVHIPEIKTGNILQRVNLSDYEIPYLAHASVECDYQIRPEDLLIKIVDGKVILKSKRIDKEIVPRLSSAHNYSDDALPVYQFLCDLQVQDNKKTMIGFKGGDFYSLFTFTPRIEYCNVVLSPATWNFKKEDYSEIIALEKPLESKVFNDWRTKWQIPDLLSLTEGDNELIINFEDENNVLIFLDVIKNRSRIQLTEFLFDLTHTLIKDSKGDAFTSECIAFLVRNKIHPEKLNQRYFSFSSLTQNVLPKRKFVLGEEWLYYKIYCGIKTADFILADRVVPLVNELKENGMVTSFFFVRYTDPDFHLRLRFHLSSIHYLQDVISRINTYIKDCIENETVSRFVIDTYNREIERYGANNISDTEHFFDIDSNSALKVIGLDRSVSDKNIRWQYAVKSIDNLFKLFDLSQNQKIQFCQSQFNHYFSEHNGDKNLKIKLDAKYRSLKNDLMEALAISAVSSTKGLKGIIEENYDNIGLLVSRFKNNIYNNKTDVDMNVFLSSLIHLMINRVFIHKQRTNELVLYHLLNKHYQSELIKINKTLKVNV